MSDDDQLIERALNAATACLLVPLMNDFDTRPIARQDFDEFRVTLDDQLHLLLDILYQNGNFLRDQAFDNQLVDLRVTLLLLCCEQTEPNSLFQTDQQILITSLAKIIDENFVNFDDSVIQKVLVKYKESLKKDSWKKHLGMIHGFPKFCEILMINRPKFIDGDLIMFLLSVGSNLLFHYDPNYKTIGLKIYRHIVERGDKFLLKDLNIHEVIYSESFQMMRKSSEIDYNENLYECLINVVKIEDSEVKTSAWCKFDDVFEELLEQIGLEGNMVVFLVLLGKIVKMCGIFHDVDCQNIDFDKVKATTMNLRTMRWVKKLMQLIVRESSKLQINAGDSLQILQAFHFIYTLSISNIDPSILGQKLEDFTKKLILIFMQLRRTFKDNEKIEKSIELFLITINQHQSQNEKLSNCISRILNQ